MPKLNPVTTWCVATMIAVAVPAGADVVDINGIQVYYEVHGEGESLLLLHGGWGVLTTGRTRSALFPRSTGSSLWTAVGTAGQRLMTPRSAMT